MQIDACRAHPRAFTLIELLVVVAIIAVLVAMLLPSLARARDSAKTTQCASYMRTIGQASIIFAGEHEGRYPGTASRTLPSISSVAWANFLNVEVLNREVFKVTAGTIQTTGAPVRGNIVCPMFTPQPGQTNRWVKYSQEAAGGNSSVPSTDPLYPWYPYGYKWPNPSEFDGLYRATGSWAFSVYWLGAKTHNFNPSQILAVEGERAADYVNAKSPYTISLNDDATYPYYAANGGNFAFRHNQYKVGNMLFHDVHVEAMSPKDEINTKRRFMIGY